MGREHRISLRRIRCMAEDCYKKPRKRRQRLFLQPLPGGEHKKA